MMKLSKIVSEAIVQELVRSFGEERTGAMLGVTPTRSVALRSGRGRLDEAQLERIETQTGRTWTAWVADAGERLATTPADRELVAATRTLCDPPSASPVVPAAVRSAASQAGGSRSAPRRRRAPAA